MGPLHGVPVSIKDMFSYAGVASTIGMVSFLDRPIPDKNSPIVDILLELGAILYCKTNVPQTMMSGDSDNNVFGRVLNPHRLNLGPGGSSGGEGALVAMKGSILGVGTDIGGSVRIPSICCGTYGFKPSSFRIPYGGATGATRRGSPGFPSVAGPLANSFEDLNMFLANVIETKPWNRDVSSLPIPWRAQVANTSPPSLRIGFLPSDPQYPVHPPVMRALESSAKKLAAAGLEVVPLTTFPSLGVGAELCWDSYSLDNTKVWLKNINAAGEPIIPSLVKQMDTIDHKPEGYTVEDIFDLNVAKMEYKNGWNKVFIENRVDVIMCPGAQNTAVPHDEYGAPVYTAIFNLLEVSEGQEIYVSNN